MSINESVPTAWKASAALGVPIVLGCMWMIASIDWSVSGRYIVFELPAGASLTVDGEAPDRAVGGAPKGSQRWSVLMGSGEHTVTIEVDGERVTEAVSLGAEAGASSTFWRLEEDDEGWWLDQDARQRTGTAVSGAK